LEELVSQALTTKIRGLYTFPNDFSSVPEGALAVADNIVIDRDSIAEPRRGFTYLASLAGRADFVVSGDRAQKIFFYDDTIIAQVLTGSTYSLVYFNPTDGWHTTAAAFNPPISTVKVRGSQAKQNLYLTRDDGVNRIDDRDSVPVRVGIPQALDVGTITEATTVKWLLNGASVAYRTAWGFKDENGNTYLGAPSGRIVYTATADCNTVLTIWIPVGITTSHYLQIYRSEQVTGTPSEEYRQVMEIFPTAGQITATHFHPPDLTIELQRLGPALYTNESQQGSGAANYIPPKAYDIATYRDFMFYANIWEQQSITITCPSIAAMTGYEDGVSVGDTITINGDVYTLVSDVDDPPYWRKFLNFSDPINTRLSIQSLVEYINSLQKSYYAVYVSGADDLPGKFMIRSYAVGGAAFSVVSSRSTAWIPPLPTSGAVQYSTADVSPNGLACSKFLEPESVPLSYRWYAGSKDAAILRILSLRDSLFILKEDGVYRFWGTDPSNFQIALLDSTANCIAPDSACVLNNMIFALTTQGVVTISETGVTIMSRAIEGSLLDLLQINPTVLAFHAFGFGAESQRAYYLYLPTISTDTGPTQYYRYNTITNNWTRGTLAKSCGGVNPVDDLVYVGGSAHRYLDVERKTKTIYDYSDYVGTETISVVANKTVTITNASTYALGQIIAQFPSFVVNAVVMGSAGGFNATSNEITANVHGYFTGTKIAFTITGGSPPAGLSVRTYWVIKIGANTIKLADTYDLAMAGTPIDFTDTGSDAQQATFTPYNGIIWGTVAVVGTTTLDVAYKCQFTLSPALILAPIATSMKWAPTTFANPGINKQVREVSIMFLADFYGSADVSFSTDASPSTLYETIIGSYPAPWGNFPWGAAPYGGVLRRRPVRVMVPRIHQRCSLISVGYEHEVAFSPWAIQGISMIGNNISEKVWHQGNTV
jgi:hypothetical protein